MKTFRLAALFIAISLTFLSTVEATPLQRIVRIADARTVIVEHEQMQSAVSLAGIETLAADDAAAIEYLQKLVGSWVLVERHGDGTADVYRSPDSLFINGEVKRRFMGSPRNTLVAAHEGTYLGLASPGPRPQRASPAAPAQMPRARATARPRPPSRLRIPGYKPPRRPSTHLRQPF
ncbi:MAG: hypothetical protein ABI837_19135 [Acidobacteriota bacterium]